MDLYDWSTTASNNTDVDGVDINEGCAPANLNNADRAIMANMAAFWKLIGGAITTGGSSNAYTLTTGFSFAALVNGFPLGFEANHTNTGAATLAVDGLTAKAIRRADNSALLAGDITSGGFYILSYESGSDTFKLRGGGTPAAFATAAQWRTGTDAVTALGPANTWAAAAEVTLTDAATIAVDLSTFINAVVTLGGNRTLGNPTNEKVGQSGVIRIVQDGTGSRTLAYGSDWEFAGGVAPVLSTAAGAQDLLFYHVIAADRVYASLAKAIA